MRLGFLTNYSQERVEFAKQAGFTCLELNAGPGSALDATKLSDNMNQIKDTLQENGIAISALAYYTNHLEDGKEAECGAYFDRLIEIAPRLGCNVIATMSGVTADSARTGDASQSIPAFKRYFEARAKVAEANGVKFAFENWPGGHPWPLLINIAISPANWELMFDAVPSMALGLEYDPSHLARLNIDYLPPIKQFGNRIYHVHGKDTTIDEDVLNKVGYIGQGWWRYSIPSLGVVDWEAFFAALKDVGYNGDVDIEHEDDAYSGANFDEGLRIGQKFLSKFVS